MIQTSYEDSRHGFEKLRCHTFQKCYLLSDSLKLLKGFESPQLDKIFNFYDFQCLSGAGLLLSGPKTRLGSRARALKI